MYKKEKTAILLLAFCLGLSACRKVPETKQEEPETHTEVFTETDAKTDTKAGTEADLEIQQSIELVGPWHLDSEKNDLTTFADSLDLFPGYREWGASMELRSDGQMSWYIGAEGWHGTYTVEDGMVHAWLTSDLEQSKQLWDFRITAKNETAVLEMAYQDMTIYWAYGDQVDIPAMDETSKVYVDRQGTDEIYSSMSITQSDNGYVIEMEIYRLGYFQGTAMEADGMLVYTDDLVNMKGTIRYDSDHAVFEVTESSSGLAEVGTTWVFPEVK